VAFGAPSVKGLALRCLARREHSRAELERKLARQVQDQPEASAAQQIAQALDDLAAHGLLSEARAAAAVLQGRGQRHGTRRLKQTLQAKGLAPELVADTLQQARATELERAHEAWRRRFGAPPADARERARQVRFLAGRGFEGEVIRRVVRGVDDDPGFADDTQGKGPADR
jgi:regulatory protein